MPDTPNIGAPAPTAAPETSSAPAADTAPAIEPSAPAFNAGAPEPSQESAVNDNPFASKDFDVDWEKVNAGQDPALVNPTEPPAFNAGEVQPPPADAPPADAAPAPATEPPTPLVPEMGAMVEQIGGASTVSALSSLIESATESPEAATIAGLGVVDAISRLDPRAGNGLLNAVYERFPQVKEWALQEMGVTPELLEVAKSLQSSGVSPEALNETFPEPDEFGVAMVDGEEFDLNIPRDKRLYDLQKADFDRVQNERKQALDNAKQQADAAEQAKVTARQQAETAAIEFSSTRQSNYMKTFDELNLNFGEGKETFVDAARALGLMQVQHDPDFQNLLVQGMDIAATGGEGAKLKAERLDSMVKDKIAEISKQFTDHFAYVARLEAAVNSGHPLPPPEANNPKPATGVNPPPPPAVPANTGLVNNENPFAAENFRVPAHLFNS